MLSKENRALVERFMDVGCYRPTDTTFGFTESRLNDLLNAARDSGADVGEPTADQLRRMSDDALRQVAIATGAIRSS